MSNIMASFFIDFQKSKAKPTLFIDPNLIPSTIGENSLQQMLLSMRVDSGTRPHSNGFHNRCSSRFDIVLHAICGKTNSKMR
jgi:hypothetical protein